VDNLRDDITSMLSTSTSTSISTSMKQQSMKTQTQQTQTQQSERVVDSGSSSSGSGSDEQNLLDTIDDCADCLNTLKMYFNLVNGDDLRLAEEVLASKR
jgi:hypothetical protein